MFRDYCSQTEGDVLRIPKTFESVTKIDFLFLLIAILMLMSGVQIQMLASSYLTYEIESSGTILGLVNAGSSIPILLFSLFGGAIADQFNRKRIILGGQLFSGLIAIVVAMLLFMDILTWHHLFAASLLQGVVFAFLFPAKQAIIPQLVGKDLLSNAVALNASVMSMTTLLAPGIAGVLYGFIGPAKLYVLISILCFSSSIFTLLIKGDMKISTGKGDAELGLGKKRGFQVVMREIGEGLSFVLKNQLIFILLLLALATTLFAMPFRFLLPIFIKDIYHLGPDAMGLLVSLTGLGALIGSLWVASLRKGYRGQVLIAGTLISGVVLLLVAAIPFYYFAVVMMLFLGLGDSIRRTTNMALLMEGCDEEYRGRIMSIYMLNFGLMPLGVLPAGFIADLVGGQISVGIFALLLVIFTAWVYFFKPVVKVTQ